MIATLKKEFLLALALAVIIGLGIGTQATFITRAGRALGAVRASLSINFIAGIVAGLVILSLLTGQGVAHWQDSSNVIPLVVVSGVFNIVSISGFAFVLQRLGVTATLTAVILGQMLSATIIDKIGFTGSEPIPLSFTRLAGLAVMTVAVVLLVPRN